MIFNRGFSIQKASLMPYGILFILGCIAWLVAVPALAADPVEPGIDWFKLVMGLFGGLAVFLLGLEHLSQALQAAAGERLKIMLARFTQNKVKGLLTGILVTALLNSSTVTTVLVVGFVSAGVMTLTQSVGVIFGANIGSTITAQIIAFDVAQYALAMIAVGFAIRLAAKTEKMHHAGAMLAGLGLLFFGMGIIGDAMLPLRTYEPFMELMARLQNPLIGIAVGLIFTAVVNSSAATLGIAIVMASDGLLTLEAGIALALGANMGTIFTTLIAAIGKPREAVRAAWVHGLFNIIGPLLWIPLIPLLTDIAVWLSPAYTDLTGTARLAEEVPRQIANAHTVLNVVNGLVFLNFTGLFVLVVMRMWPDKPVEAGKLIVEAKFLNKELLDTPSLALEHVRMEIGHMGEITQTMLRDTRTAFRTSNRGLLDEVEKLDDQVDLLHERIIHYLGNVRENDMTKEQEDEFFNLLSATDDLEALADVIETDLLTVGRQYLDRTDISLSETITVMLKQLADVVEGALDNAIKAVQENDPKKAQDVLVIKDEFMRTGRLALEHQSTRLAPGDQTRLAGYRLEVTLMDKLERIYRLTRRMAKSVLPTELLAEMVE